MNRLISVLFLIALTIVGAGGAERFVERNTIYSQSGQFVIAGKSLRPASAFVYGVDTNWNRLVPVGRQPGGKPRLTPKSGVASTDQVLDLDPAFLAASAERIKQAIWDRLNLVEMYRGKVYITLLQPTDPPQEILVMHMRNARGRVWDYKLEIPEEVAADHLLRAITHVVLLEAANRHRQPQLAEIPLWYQEGMVAHLQATVAKSVFFDQEKRISFTGRLNQEIEDLKREIDEEPVFNLEQLSWPGTLKAGAETERQFRLASHGMVAELLRLQGGGDCLGNMLRLLPRYENWQFAFLHAFQGHFATLLDFEKWWAVTSVDLSSGVLKQRQPTEDDLIFRTEFELSRWQRVTAWYLGNRGANEEWPLEDCYIQLGHLLHVPVEWQTGVDGEVSREQIGLRDIMNNMEFSLQVPVMEQRVAQLFGLQLHSPPELASLVRSYRLVIEKYIVDREASYAVNTFKMNPTTSPVVVTRNALKKLDELDKKRAEMSELLLKEDEPAEEQIADARQ